MPHLRMWRILNRDRLLQVHLLCADVARVVHEQLACVGAVLDDGPERHGGRVEGDLHAVTRPRHDEQRLGKAGALQHHLATESRTTCQVTLIM